MLSMYLIGYCPNRFRPLNDGSTDMLIDEEPLGYEGQLEKMRPQHITRTPKKEDA